MIQKISLKKKIHFYIDTFDLGTTGQVLRILTLPFLFILSLNEITAQSSSIINPVLLHGYWPAHWITCPNESQRDYGVYHFRKTFSLQEIPGKFVVHISADNRYRFFVNGAAVCSGPARGDLYNWYFETVDISKFLHTGNNIVAALVWNMGVYAAVGQISNQTAFLLQGDGEKEKMVNTDDEWKVIKDNAYHPCSTDNMQRLRTYMVIGPGDQVDAAQYPWGWELPEFDDKPWSAAQKVATPVVTGYGTDNQWTLVPRNIPLMEETKQRIPTVRRSYGMEVETGFLNGNQTLTVAPNSTVSILMDQTFNTVGFPELIVSMGKGAMVKLTYSEALFDRENHKGNRNDIEGKEIKGNYDVFEPDGGARRFFRPLWFRTWRYIQLDITTKEQPLRIDDFYGMYTGYPFKASATFASNDESLQDIWKVGWRTARLCAGETYFDCPYYEQLQYEGDTRIQSLISLYVSGDDRLMRKALLDFYHSRVPEGLTQGRYPSNRLQVIPPFSLYWISMVFDYWMHRKDDVFIQQFLTPVRGILEWYEKNLDSSKKMLGPMKWWNFTDWNKAFANGVPDGAVDGNSSVVTLQFAYTLQQAAQVFTYYGKTAEGIHYATLASQLEFYTYRQCFDKSKKLMANTPAKTTFSQHASIMGVLSGSIPATEAKEVMKKLLADTTVSQATFYYRFYLTQALKKAHMADLYYSQLKPWRGMLENGLTTFAENPDPTRSDCHAWSSSPNYDFLATICGIMPAKPGFSEVIIEPALGELTQATGNVPLPDGEISVTLHRRAKNGIIADISLPLKLAGKFIWMGREVKLRGGKQTIIL